VIVSRRVAVRAALVVCVLAIACIPLGRWQAQRATAADRHRIDNIAAIVGPLASRTPTAYRLAMYDCLLYPVGHDPYALELCFDLHGRLVEAIDRAHVGYLPKVGTVRYDAAKAPIVVAPAGLLKLFHRGGALRGLGLVAGALPGPFADLGPVPTPAGTKLLKTAP
jgi:hypothetical protein